MVPVLLSALIVLAAAYLCYRYIVKPKQLISFYSKLFSPYFSIYQYPFAPFQVPEHIKIEQDLKKSHDCFKTCKEVCSEFDLVISNIVDRAYLSFVSPKLIQAFFELEEDKCYSKYDLLLHGIRRMLGNGITFSKG